jgi:hypothetical protein
MTCCLIKPNKRVKEGIQGAELVLVTSQEIDELCEADNSPGRCAGRSAPRRAYLERSRDQDDNPSTPVRALEVLAGDKRQEVRTPVARTRRRH